MPQVRDSADSVPAGYVAPMFQTKALKHTSVQLTWDADDVARKKACPDLRCPAALAFISQLHRQVAVPEMGLARDRETYIGRQVLVRR